MMRSLDYYVSKGGLAKSVRTALATERGYFLRNKEKMNYAELREQGLPIGSGAIESGIRRVINLRLKNNGMFWREEHAEEMLQVRAQVI
jgi:hypothetical protein